MKLEDKAEIVKLKDKADTVVLRDQATVVRMGYSGQEFDFTLRDNNGEALLDNNNVALTDNR